MSVAGPVRDPASYDSFHALGELLHLGASAHPREVKLDRLVQALKPLVPRKGRTGANGDHITCQEPPSS